MLANLLKRLPSRDELLFVLSFTSFLVYGRMLYVFTWKLPSWMKYLTVNEILSILSYSLAIALLESGAYVLILALFSGILPASWFRREFVARSVWIVAIWLISWMIYFSRMAALGMEGGFAILDYLYTWLAGTLALMLVAGWLTARIRLMSTAALWLADRALIFLFLLIPASLLGFVVVLIRNIS